MARPQKLQALMRRLKNRRQPQSISMLADALECSQRNVKDIIRQLRLPHVSGGVSSPDFKLLEFEEFSSTNRGHSARAGCGWRAESVEIQLFCTNLHSRSNTGQCLFPGFVNQLLLCISGL